MIYWIQEIKAVWRYKNFMRDLDGLR
jgi:hypothetical protein